MKVGAYRYEFTTEAPWFVQTPLVQQRTRSRLRSNDTTMITEAVELDISAAEVLAIAANTVNPENNEGLWAIGAREKHHHLNLASRTDRAAAARGLTSHSSGRHWRQAYMKPFVRLTARELYRMIHYPDNEIATEQ